MRFPTCFVSKTAHSRFDFVVLLRGDYRGQCAPTNVGGDWRHQEKRALRPDAEEPR